MNPSQGFILTGIFLLLGLQPVVKPLAKLSFLICESSVNLIISQYLLIGNAC